MQESRHTNANQIKMDDGIGKRKNRRTSLGLDLQTNRRRSPLQAPGAQNPIFVPNSNR